jgi:acetolactate synthase-1/2/3 large subunit
MDLEIHRHSHVDFDNPDFVKYAESFGAKGYSPSRRLTICCSTLKKALADHTLSVIACPGRLL